MERRKFLIGAGSAAVGSSALIGSGAFSAVQADRTVTVNVKNDQNAYLGIDGDNAYTSESDGTLEIDFGANGYGGSGLNAGATTEFTDLLEVTNQGTEDVLVWVNLNDLNDKLNSGFVTAYLSMEDYGAGMDGGDGGPAEESQAPGTSGSTGDWGVILAPGKSAEIAFQFQNLAEDEVDNVYNSTIGVHAAAEDSEMYSDVVNEYNFSSYQPKITE